MEILLALQEIRTPFLDGLMSILTKLGEEMLVLPVLMLVYWCLDKEAGKRLCLTYFVCGLAGQTLKLAFRVERPFALDSRLTPVDKALKAATGYSFPSGHAISATSLTMAVGLWLKKGWLWAVGAVYIASVAFTRLYLGVHTPEDIALACLMAVLLSLAANAVLNRIRKTGKAKGWFIGALVASVLIMVFAAVSVKALSVPEEQAADAFKTGGAAVAFLLGLWIDQKWLRFPTKAVFWQQAVKLGLGLLIAVGLKEGLKLALGVSLPMQALRYFITVGFLVLGWPALFTVWQRKGAKATKEE